MPIIAALILAVGGVIGAILTRSQPQTLTPTPTAILSTTTPFAAASSSPNPVSTPTILPSATAVVISPTTAWVATPTAYQFGASAPNHIINLTLYPGEILSLTTDVGTFMARATNGTLIPVPLPAASSKVFVLIWEGDSNSTAETIQVTGVSSGNIDWERRQPPTGTPWLSAAMAVEQRVAGGLKLGPNCGNGCATVGYYILDSAMYIKQTSEPNAVA